MEASHFREHLGAGLLGGMRRYGDRGQCPSDLERAGALRRACVYRRAHALRRDTLMPQIFLSLPRTMPASLTRHTSTG